MPGDTKENNETLNRRLEYLVPLFSFGGAFFGILIWIYDIAVDVHISITGCLLASCVLAYLAWIRPEKDLVALTTPLYSVIFLGFPLDALSTVVLEVLYAVSLSILLVRLRRRFGVPVSASNTQGDLAEPIRNYVEKIPHVLQNVSQESGHAAAMVVIWFARGDYNDAARVADQEVIKLNEVRPPRVVQEAFVIVREQAERLDKSFPAPQRFATFSSDTLPVLVKEPGSREDTNDLYNTTLENALVLLFACAWAASEQNRGDLLGQQGFVLQLIN